MPLILIVDDDDDIAEIYQFVLSAAGFRTARATNGAEGLALEDELEPDLILLDVNMPVLDGLEMLRRRDATRRARTPVIVNSSDPTNEHAALDAGAALFLPKAESSADLLAAIDVTLRRADSGVEARRRRAGDVVADQTRDGERRERVVDRLDATAPELQERIGALVRWLAGYYEMGVAWVDVLQRGRILVEAAFRRPAQPAYDLVHRVVLSESIAGAHSPALVGDLQSTPWFRAHPAAQAGYRFFAGVPLRGPDDVSLGALCIADAQPRAFDAANLTVLQHCGTEFGHRIAQLAGAAVSGPFLFYSPSVLNADTLNVLIAAELLRSRRRQTGFEVALIRLVSPAPGCVDRCAARVRDAVDGRGCAVASHSPSLFALVVRGDDAGRARARMDASLRALWAECSDDVADAGVVALANGASATFSASDVLRAAQSVLANVPPDSWMRREELHHP